MDLELLLLSNRNSDAQFATAGDSKGGSRLEKTATCRDRCRTVTGYDRGATATRAAPGRTTGSVEQGECATPRRRNFTSIVPQCHDASGIGETRPGENHRTRSRARPTRR